MTGRSICAATSPRATGRRANAAKVAARPAKEKAT